MTSMSLLTLLLGILTTLFSLPGCPQAETAATALPARELVLEPQCDRELTGREEERMLAAVKYRCELVGLRGVQVRREGRNYLLRVNSGLIQSMEEYTDTLDELESVLNERTNLQLLRVHPDSSVLVRDAEVQTLLGRYESAMVAYEENHNPDEVPPQVPELPERLGVPAFRGYCRTVFTFFSQVSRQCCQSGWLGSATGMFSTAAPPSMCAAFCPASSSSSAEGPL